MDSYRPDAKGPPTTTRGYDTYRPSHRSQPPPVHMVKEREIFLRNASEDERDNYLRQNRKAICKEITCPHQFVKDCRHGDKCMYSHDDTGHYFPLVGRPSKEWTCFFWLDKMGCSRREETCLFSHYDTGLYATANGKASTKHVTCFWWAFKDGGCSKGANCFFAHHETGILAEDPSRRHPAQRPQSPVRKTSDVWRPNTSTNKTTQTLVSKSSSFVRDTPLSPAEPDYTESDEYEPPSVRVTPQPELSAESPSRSPIPPLRPVVNALPRETSEIPITVADGRGSTYETQLGTSDGSTLATNPNGLMPNGNITDEPPVAAIVAPSAPKQYARRTGGVKIRKKRPVPGADHLSLNNDTTETPEGDGQVANTEPQINLQPAKTSDPRKRKPDPPILDPSHNVSSDKDGRLQDEVQVTPTQPHNVHQPVQSSPNYVRCQACQKLMFPSKAASHRCQNMQNGQQHSVDPKTEDLCGATSQSLSPHPRDQSLSINTQVEPSNDPDVTITAENMEETLSKTHNDSRISQPASHAPLRSESSSDAENLFISNKKRKRVSSIAVLTHTSARSPNGAQGHGPPFAKRIKPATPVLSISELTELEALRKEFTWDEESNSDDNAATLDILRVMKKNKDDRQRRRALKEAEEMAREEAEEAARKARRVAEREERLRQIEAEEARIVAEKEERLRRLKAELIARDTETAAELEGGAPKQTAQGRSRSADEDVQLADASEDNIRPGSPTKPAHPSACDKTVPTPVPSSQKHSSFEHPAEIQEVEKRFNGIFSVIHSESNTSITQANGPLSTLSAQHSTENHSTMLQDQSLLSSASSDEDGIEHDDIRIGNPTRRGRRGRSCETCRKKRVRARAKPLALAHKTNASRSNVTT